MNIFAVDPRANPAEGGVPESKNLTSLKEVAAQIYMVSKKEGFQPGCGGASPCAMLEEFHRVQSPVHRVSARFRRTSLSGTGSPLYLCLTKR